MFCKLRWKINLLLIILISKQDGIKSNEEFASIITVAFSFQQIIQPFE